MARFAFDLDVQKEELGVGAIDDAYGVIQSPIEFGDRLIDALPERENTGLGIHLPNTLRKQSSRSDRSEKMVDTALASDLLSWARSEPSSLAIVASGDDDAIPPAFTAEAWMRPFGGRVRVLRPSARNESKFLRLEGLVN